MSFSGTPGFAACTCVTQLFISACLPLSLLVLACRSGGVWLWALAGGCAWGCGVVGCCARATLAAASAVKANAADSRFTATPPVQIRTRHASWLWAIRLSADRRQYSSDNCRRRACATG